MHVHCQWHCYTLRLNHDTCPALFTSSSSLCSHHLDTSKNGNAPPRTYTFTKQWSVKHHLNTTSTTKTQPFVQAVAVVFRLGILKTLCRIYCSLEHCWHPIITPENSHLFICLFPKTNLPLHAVGVRVSFVSKAPPPLLWGSEYKMGFSSSNL